MEEENIIDHATDNIFFIRLVTGEDIISIVEEGESDHPEEDEPAYLKLYYPQKVVYTFEADSPEKMHIQLHQWVFTYLSEGQTFDIANHDILTIAEPSHEFKVDYLDCIKLQIERAESSMGSFVPDKDSKEEEDTLPQVVSVKEGKSGDMLRLFEEHTSRGKQTLH